MPISITVCSPITNHDATYAGVRGTGQVMTSSSTHLPPRSPRGHLRPVLSTTSQPHRLRLLGSQIRATKLRVSPFESFLHCRKALDIRLAHARSDVGCETGPRSRGQFTRSHRTRRRRRSKDCMRRRVSPRQQANVAPRGRRAHHAVMCCRSQLQAVAVFGIPAVSPQHDGYVRRRAILPMVKLLLWDIAGRRSARSAEA